jgi:hypothetical protein
VDTHDEPGDVQVVESDVPVEHDPEAFDPSTIRDPLPQPLFSWRRVVIVLLLLAAVGCLVIAARSAGDTGSGGDLDAAIISYTPDPGGRVLRQSQVGVELEPGYDGRLSINGVSIPEEQMVGAIVPGSEAWERLSPEQQRLGPRPNNKNLVMFQPGEGKAITEYDTGAVDVSVRFWKLDEGPDSARTVSYTIYVV